MIEAKSGPLAPRHDANSNFTTGNALESNIIKFLFSFLYFLSINDIFQWFEVDFLLSCWLIFVVEVNIFIKLIGLFEIKSL